MYAIRSYYEIGDLTTHGERVLLAKGGSGGLGNIHFKSSVNRAPRQFTRGRAGEQRELALELRVLADVGLLGLPNAGKSTFLRAVSAARPKVADYPFTTLNPTLGVVRLGDESSVITSYSIHYTKLYEDVLQLADVAREVVRHELFERLRRKPRRRAAGLLRNPFQDGLRDDRHVLRTRNNFV